MANLELTETDVKVINMLIENAQVPAANAVPLAVFIQKVQAAIASKPEPEPEPAPAKKK